MTLPSGATKIAWWDARTTESNPTYDATTGVISSFGTELYSTGATFAATNSPRMATGSWPGMLLPHTNEITGSQRAGMLITGHPTVKPSTMMLVAVVTPLNLVGDNSSASMRVFVCDVAGAGPFCGIIKNCRNANGGSTPSGTLLVHGGAATQNTVGVTGIERQAIGYRGTSTPAGFAYSNSISGSKNTTGATGSTTAVTKINVGAFDVASALNTNGPFMGIIHAVWIVARDTSWTDAEILTSIAEMEASWSVLKTTTSCVSIQGDSIAYSSGSAWDANVTTGAGSGIHSGTLANPCTKDAVSLVLNAGETMANADRAVLDPGTSVAEVVVLSGKSGDTFTCTATKYAHSASAAICAGGNYGYMHPGCMWPTMSKKTGDGSGFVNLNVGTASANATALNFTTGTTLAVDSAVGALALIVAAGEGSRFSNNQQIVIGAGTSNAESVKITTVTVDTFTVPAMTKAHTAGESILHDPDGSLCLLTCGGSTTKIYASQRASNDIVALGTSAANLLTYKQNICANARLAGASYVIEFEVMGRVDCTGGTETVRTTHNTNLNTAGNQGTTTNKWDVVCKWAQHPWLQGDGTSASACYNPATLTVSGATASTAITGMIFDGAGVHPRAFGNACQALMWDKAVATATSTSVGYAPAAVTPTARAGASGNTITWTTPTSTGAPTIPGQTGDGPSCLQVQIRRNGSLIATVAPATINTNTGDATYTTSYLDAGRTPGDVYTLTVVDAAGNTSGATANFQAPVSTGGGRNTRVRYARAR